MAALLLSLCSYSFAQPCSQATVRGTWGWQAHGTAIMTVPGSAIPVPVPFASLGFMTVDYQGQYIAHGTISIGGRVQDADIPGSIQVNPDCTAMDTYATGAGRLTILDNGNEMRYLPTKHPLGPVAGMAYFQRIAWGEPQCTADMIRGVYGGTAEGTVMVPVSGQPRPVPTPFSGIIAATFQRTGAGTAVSTASLGGNIFDFEFPKNSIAVNPDCTAILEWTAVSKQVPGQTFVGTNKYIVLDHGNELFGLETKDSVGPSIVIHNLKRISMRSTAADQ
jgi:hypothetical protein